MAWQTLGAGASEVKIEPVRMVQKKDIGEKNCMWEKEGMRAIAE